MQKISLSHPVLQQSISIQVFRKHAFLHFQSPLKYRAKQKQIVIIYEEPIQM